jgi:hypothetical protein
VRNLRRGEIRDSEIRDQAKSATRAKSAINSKSATEQIKALSNAQNLASDVRIDVLVVKVGGQSRQ